MYHEHEIYFCCLRPLRFLSYFLLIIDLIDMGGGEDLIRVEWDKI